MLTPNSQFIPPTPPFPFGNHKFVFYVCESICYFVNKFICIIFLDSTCKRYHIFVFVWLTAFSMIISRSIHVAASGFISFFLWFKEADLGSTERMVQELNLLRTTTLLGVVGIQCKLLQPLRQAVGQYTYQWSYKCTSIGCNNSLLQAHPRDTMGWVQIATIKQISQ